MTHFYLGHILCETDDTASFNLSNIFPEARTIDYALIGPSPRDVAVSKTQQLKNRSKVQPETMVASFRDHIIRGDEKSIVTFSTVHIQEHGLGSAATEIESLLSKTKPGPASAVKTASQQWQSQMNPSLQTSTSDSLNPPAVGSSTSLVSIAAADSILSPPPPMFVPLLHQSSHYGTPSCMRAPFLAGTVPYLNRQNVVNSITPAPPKKILKQKLAFASTRAQKKKHAANATYITTVFQRALDPTQQSTRKKGRRHTNQICNVELSLGDHVPCGYYISSEMTD